MGSVKGLLVLSFVVSAQVLFLTGCATSEGSDPTFDVPRPNYGQASPKASDVEPVRQSDKESKTQAKAKAVRAEVNPNPAPIIPEGSMMRHSLRQLAEYDSYKMGKLVNREINLKDEDDENYLNQVAITLGQTVFIQPHFTERETALKELKGKVDQEDYIVVLQKAADDLLNISKNSPSPSDQAGSLVALTNLVTECRTLKRPELRGVLQKIADANLKVSEEAQKYASDPMERLISPSREAQSALKAL